MCHANLCSHVAAARAVEGDPLPFLCHAGVLHLKLNCSQSKQASTFSKVALPTGFAQLFDLQSQVTLFDDVVNAVAAPLVGATGAGGDVGVEVKLSRSDRVYHAGEPLQGEVVITSNSGPVHHNGVVVVATGAAQMRVSERAVGVFEAFFLNIRPVVLLNETVEVCPLPTATWSVLSFPSAQVVPPGRFDDGVTRLPFSLPLRPASENPKTPLYETYHGVNVNVQASPPAFTRRCRRLIKR